MLDQPAMAAGKGYFQIGATAVSPNDRLLAYAEDAVGRRQYVLKVKDMSTGQVLADTVANVEPDLVWSDVTRFLVAQGYAAKGRVAAMGGSAGGLLMGAVANIAPSDYRVIIAQVPFVDVVTTMLDASIPLTTNEYDEWGNPAQKPAYDYMLSYSPYDNVRPQAYPAMFVGTGLWDSQVQYYEPTKWVAKLRATGTGTAPLVFRVNMEAGHGGKSGRFRRYRDQAEYLAFALEQLGAN